jgi:hypothetical protein
VAGTFSPRGLLREKLQCIYVGGHVKDPTPMLNNYFFGGEATKSWDADAIQLRIDSNPDIKSTASVQTGGQMLPEDQQFGNHVTLWYSTQDAKAGYSVA